MKKYVIVVAGGSGSRMNAAIPKQFLLLGGQPVLFHTLNAFYQFDATIELILVLPEGHMAHWQSLITEYHFKIKHQIVKGGETRFESVKNGLNRITEDGIVAIHDGARPLVTSAIIKSTFDQAAIYGNGVAAVSIKDSIRQVTDGKNKTVDRDDYRAIQTPQTFKSGLIKEAFARAHPQKTYSDDASVLEDFGEIIFLTEGGYENIKITTPEDLAIAESILQLRK